jgi:hypothetical protein
MCLLESASKLLVIGPTQTFQDTVAGLQLSRWQLALQSFPTQQIITTAPQTFRVRLATDPRAAVSSLSRVSSITAKHPNKTLFLKKNLILEI